MQELGTKALSSRFFVTQEDLLAFHEQLCDERIGKSKAHTQAKRR